MKNLLKGAGVTAAIMIVLLVISVLCNMNDINLDSTMTGTMSAVCAMLIFCGLTKKEKN